MFDNSYLVRVDKVDSKLILSIYLSRIQDGVVCISFTLYMKNENKTMAESLDITRMLSPCYKNHSIFSDGILDQNIIYGELLHMFVCFLSGCRSLQHLRSHRDGAHL